jgi:hypothetical protein
MDIKDIKSSELEFNSLGNSFSRVLDEMKLTDEFNIAWRAGWNGSDMFICLQQPDEHSKMTLPYLFLRTAGGDLVPWLASQTDLLAEDWYLADIMSLMFPE